MSAMYNLDGKTIWIAGHRGLVGSALVRKLENTDAKILTAARDEVDLRRQRDVEEWMTRHRPDAVIIAAATVGGIHANSTRPAEFLYDNLMIESNIINTAYELEIEKLLFLGSTCIYPRLAPQPMPEESLLTGPLEPTNEWYAIAKIAGIKLCQAFRHQYGCNFISAMPTNLYGPGDNFDLESSHVLPALIRKMHDAKLSDSPTVPIWGTGSPRREFLHVDDCADALLFLLQNYDGDTHINVGSGEEVSILELAETIKDVVGFNGSLAFDATKPDGTPRKLVDNTKLMQLGWKASIPLRDGIASTYGWMVDNA